MLITQFPTSSKAIEVGDAGGSPQDGLKRAELLAAFHDPLVVAMALVARECGATMALRRRPTYPADPVLDGVEDVVEVLGESAESLSEAAEALGEIALRFLDWLTGEPAEALARAQRREITRRTARTPLERRAVLRASYERRRATVQPGESVRSRLGHGPAPVVTWSAVPTTVGLRKITTTSRVETRRVGQYSRDVRLLLDGDLDAADFRRRWSRRKRGAGGFELEPDPDKVLVLRAEAGPPPEPFYRRRQRRAA